MVARSIHPLAPRCKLFNNADDDYKKDVSLGSKLELPLTAMVTGKPPLKKVSDPNGVR